MKVTRRSGDVKIHQTVTSDFFVALLSARRLFVGTHSGSRSRPKALSTTSDRAGWM